jgi:hypothetical protein
VTRAKCPSGKRCRSQLGAIAAAIRCSRRGAPLRVYRCPHCHTWHLTHQPLRTATEATP